jgi:deoxyribonuclease V
MEVVKTEYLPNPDLTREEMRGLQRRISEEAVFDDRLGFDTSVCSVTVAGVDQAFTDDASEAVSAVVVMHDDEVVEKTHAITETGIPYIPGLLAFREGGPILESLENLSKEPDVLMVDGSGRIHPRQAGLATHIGVALEVPTVGVAKSLLCGTPHRSFERLERGERVPILADDSVDAPDGTTIGYAVQTKQYTEDASTTVNPLYVSPGHRVSVEKAADFVVEGCDRYKLPEPVRRADALADDQK